MRFTVAVVLILAPVLAQAAGFKYAPSSQQLTLKSADQRLDDLWSKYKETHNKKYAKTEEKLRREIWEQHVEEVQRHNLEYDLGLHTYTMGVNEYTDLTPEEYSKYLLGFRGNDKMRSGKRFSIPNDVDKNLPATVDWRNKGYVTPIKNQGRCGSCWAFSSTGSLEGQHYLKTGKLVSLSEQNLVDCTRSYGNAGCNGGWMDNAFKYVQANNGIDTEAYYPYEGIDDRCGYSPSPGYKGANCTGHIDIPKGSEHALKRAVALIGPISVAIDAAHASFQQYRSGVYNEAACSNSSSDHAVLVVGYGAFQGTPYWLVKNSWGTSWGMNGYIMMSRNKDNQCAIATYASYPEE